MNSDQEITPILPTASLKPIAKCIDIKNLRDWIPEPKRRRVGLRAAWERIKKHYCAALVGRGVCPVQCELCKEHLLSIFDMSEDRSPIRDPEALLTYRAKEESTKVIEERIAQEHRNEQFLTLETAQTREEVIAALFRRDDVNPFIALQQAFREERERMENESKATER